MAAGPAIEAWSKQTATAEVRDNTRTARRTRGFTVILDASDVVDVAYSASGLPLVGDLFPGSTLIAANRIQATRVSPIMAFVQVDYEGEVGPDDESGPEDNEVIIEWGASIADEAIDQDINGKPTVTVNNEPIDGLTERTPDLVARISRKFLAINTYAIREYLKSRNSDEFLDWPAGTVRFWDYSARQVWTNGLPGPWDVSMEFHFREPYNTTNARAWYKRVRHEGYLVRTTPASEPRIAWDKVTKAPVSRPVLLKADGTEETDPDSAHWLEFETTRSLSYAALGILE
jgi:hypothetical protein